MSHLLARLNPFCEVTITSHHYEPGSRESRQVGERTLTLPIAHLAAVWFRLSLAWHRRAVRRSPENMRAHFLLGLDLLHTNQTEAARAELNFAAASSDADSADAVRRILKEWLGEGQ